MRRTGSTGQNMARLVQYAFLLALALRLAIAPGMMPALAENGTITLQICADAGVSPRTIEVPIERADGEEGGAPSRADHCPFAAFAAAPILPDSPLLSDVAVPAWPVPQGLPAFALSLGAASPLPPSTGPPMLV
ncbi:MAG: hypothetical protein R3E02_09830 [Blastomonas sp.]